MSHARDVLVTQSVLGGYGLLRLPLVEAASAITVGPPRQEWDRRIVATGQSPSAALDFLATVTWPATRYVLFALDHDWTVIANNQKGGSEVADVLRRVRSGRPVTAVRVVDHDDTFVEQNGFRVRRRFGARIVEIQADGEDLRSIACAEDGGRWTFHTAGRPLPVEAQFDHDARRIRDRFTHENLDALLRSIGARSIEAADLANANAVTLLTMTPHDDQWHRRIESRSCTIEEADDPAFGYFERGMGWVEHMAAHPISVIADLGKAILLDPSLEPRCRPALDRARAQLGDAAFDQALAEAPNGLRRI